MQLVYSSPEEIMINVTLDEGEWLGDLVGPTVAHVPTDPMNRHYAEIVEGNYQVDAYGAPAQLAQPPAQVTVHKHVTVSR
jgi:hypothetical protein